MSFNEKMTAIADKIRSLLQIEDLLTLDDMPDKISEVDEQSWLVGYETGYADGEENTYQSAYYEGYQTGISDGLTEGKAAGQKAEYDRFWDAYQENGNRVNYNYSFSGSGWTDKSYNPKYVMKPTACTQMYYSSKITDTKVPIDLTATGTNHTYLFTYCTNLVTINKLIVDLTRKYTESFTDCSSLKNITIEGAVGRSINLQWCPLTPESAWSVVQHLAPFIPGEEGYMTYTVTFSQAVWEALNEYTIENELHGWVTVRDYIENDIGWKTA